MTYRRLVFGLSALATLTLLAVIVGCTTGEDCPDISGDWEVTSHCNDDFVGAVVAFEQDGCEVESGGSFEGFSGTVSDNGDLNIGGEGGGSDVITCEGVATSGQITIECSDGCNVILQD